MTFNSRSQFTSAQASEKITLVHVHATTRLVAWNDEGGGIYSKSVSHFIYELKNIDVNLIRVSDLGDVVPGTFYYSPQLGTLYIQNIASEDPNLTEMITTFRFFYSNVTIDTTWDLDPLSAKVPYSGLIKKSPGYKQKIGIDQNLTSLVGGGNLVLANDGSFDDIFDQYYFENQLVSVYSWNRDLPIDESTILFRGRITNKNFGSSEITFTIKDTIYDLGQNIPQNVYNDNDNVNSSVKGNFKRWVYGRVNGLSIQSIDQIADGYAITGTVSINPLSAEMVGTGTSFLNDLSPNDRVTIGTQKFTIESVDSNTSAQLSDSPDFSTSGALCIVVPEIPTVVKNRNFLVTDHSCTELEKTVSSIKQLNRVFLNNNDGLLVGDILEFDTSENIEIKGFSDNGGVVLVKNLTTSPTIGSAVIRKPIQKVFFGSTLISNSDFSVTNSGQLTVTLDSDTEFNIAEVRAINTSLTFTNGSRSITYSGDSLEEVLFPRDWIRPLTGSGDYYQILQVTPSEIIIRTNFDQTTTSQAAQYKHPDYIGDNSILSVDVLGRTEDGTPSGVWIKTAPQVIKDALNSINITDINTTSFTNGINDSPQTISLSVPTSPGSSSTTAKSLIDMVNKSVLSSITTDNNLDIKYSSLLAVIDDNVPVISDKDIISWNISAVAGRIFQNAVIRYRHSDIDINTLEPGNSVITHSSDFVRNYIGTTLSSELDARLYSEDDATIRAHREIYYNRLAKTEVTLVSDLRLDQYEIGDSIKLDIERLYKRLGDVNNKQKIMKIVGKSANGNKVELILNDIANIYNTSSIITPNSAPDYSSASSDDKIKYGYITDSQGIIDDEEDTANIHLIS